MDWTQLIITLLGGTSVVGIWESIRYRKQNAVEKSAEAAKVDYEAQAQGIDLAKKFACDTLENMKMFQTTMEEMRQHASTQNEEVITRPDKMDGTLSNVVEYLNGDFKKFLKKKEEGGEE